MERVPAVGRTLAIPSASIDRRQLPTSGESVLLVYAESAGEDILVTTANGVSLRLTGLGWLGTELKAGDTLPVRVVSTHPTLELEFASPVRSPRGTSGAAAGLAHADSMSQHAAMRLDQAELRTISWRPPDPAVLAAAWRTLALERWQQPLSAIDPWATPVYAWGGISIVLRLIEADEEPPVPRAPRRRGMALRLDLMHPLLGHIVIQVQWTPRGIRLALLVEDDSSVEAVRERLPAVGAALAHANFKLAHLSVTHGDVGTSAAVARVPDRLFASHSLSPSLFRSAAEIVVAVLSLTRASR